MKTILTLEEIKSSVAQVAPLYDVKKVVLFGSYADGKQTKNSDIDLLVEFSEKFVSLFVIIGMQQDLEELTGKNVDVIHAPIPKGSLIKINSEVVVYE